MKGEVNQWSVSIGASLLGTAKRMRSFPFTYDQTPGPDRQLVTEKGAAAQYWAKKMVQHGPTVTNQYAMASRNGLGRVIMMQTTIDSNGPGKFTLVTQRQCRDTVPEPTTNEKLLQFETYLIEQLIATQRSPEWFNQRQFRITGTSAFAQWKRFAHLALSGSGGFEMTDRLRGTCKILSLKHSNEPIPDENVVDRVFNNEELLQLSVSDLKDICRQKGVPVSGKKTTLINRILQQGGGSQHSNAERPVLELLLEKWFMSPFASSTSMCEGTLNKSNVLARLALFVDEHSEYTVIDFKEYGVLCAKDIFYAEPEQLHATALFTEQNPVSRPSLSVLPNAPSLPHLHSTLLDFFPPLVVMALKTMKPTGEIQLNSIPVTIIEYISKISMDLETILMKSTYTYLAWLNSTLGRSAGLIPVYPSLT